MDSLDIPTASELFQVPELLHLTFRFLSLRSLAACTRVSHRWFPVAIEHLWRSVDIKSVVALTACGRKLTNATLNLEGPVSICPLPY